MGGDLTGKGIVPLIRLRWSVARRLHGREVAAHEGSELDRRSKDHRHRFSTGCTPTGGTREEADALSATCCLQDALFERSARRP